MCHRKKIIYLYRFRSLDIHQFPLDREKFVADSCHQCKESEFALLIYNEIACISKHNNYNAAKNVQLLSVTK